MISDIFHAHIHYAQAIACYTDKAEQSQQQPGTYTVINPAEDHRKKQ